VCAGAAFTFALFGHDFSFFTPSVYFILFSFFLPFFPFYNISFIPFFSERHRRGHSHRNLALAQSLLTRSSDCLSPCAQHKNPLQVCTGNKREKKKDSFLLFSLSLPSSFKFKNSFVPFFLSQGNSSKMRSYRFDFFFFLKKGKEKEER
jgi:hypothetical protein